MRERKVTNYVNCLIRSTCSVCSSMHKASRIPSLCPNLLLPVRRTFTFASPGDQPQIRKLMSVVLFHPHQGLLPSARSSRSTSHPYSMAGCPQPGRSVIIITNARHVSICGSNNSPSDGFPIRDGAQLRFCTISMIRATCHPLHSTVNSPITHTSDNPYSRITHTFSRLPGWFAGIVQE